MHAEGNAEKRDPRFAAWRAIDAAFKKVAMLRRVLLPLIAALLLGGCASPSYTYRYVPGRTAILREGYAIAPPEAPPDVQAAIAAGNRIAGLPYARGGGHGSTFDSTYDCSGATSYVLIAAGKLGRPTTSTAFRHYGRSGEGEWITLYARRGHVFLSVAGLRFDTGYNDGSHGPQWTTRSRPAPHAVLRHPAGL